MRHLFLLPLLLVLGACAILPGGKPATGSSTYLLDASISVGSSEPGCQIVVVNPPVAAPGQMGAQMLYQRHANQIERFAYSRWAATPDAMIEPLLLNVLRDDGRFSAVLSSPAPVRADLRIENDDLWLIQVFEGERSFIDLRMSTGIYAPAERRLLATTTFNYQESATETTPAAGVAAANRAVQRLLTDYHAFVDETADAFGNHCRSQE